MFQLTLSIIVVVFIIELTVSIRNYTYRNEPIPSNVKDVYEPDAYRKWRKYTAETFRFSTIMKVLHTMLLIVLLFMGFFPWLANFSSRLTSNPIAETIVFLALYYLLEYLVDIGPMIYRNFSIEERYGFNKTTPKTFLADQVKSLGLTALLGGGLLYGFLVLYSRLGSQFVLYAWVALMVLSLLINVLYTKVFVRLFNKLTPLPEGELKEKIRALADQTDYEVRKISVMDASKRSTRLNAFFSGFGRFKQIVLFDTLVEKCDADEVVSVLAHEIGHAEHKDVWKNFLLSSLQIAGILALLALFLDYPSLVTDFGFSSAHLGFSLVLFAILSEPLSLLLGIPLSAHSRKAEYRADAYTVEVGYGGAMIRALKILARENFSNLTPHPWMVKLRYSHPPISQRIEAIEVRMEHRKDG